MALFVPDELVTFPPPDHMTTALYIKHIEIYERAIRSPVSYKRVDGNLFLEYLISRDSPQVIDRLMTVCFHYVSQSEVINPSQEILERGLMFSGEMYRFLGHSNTQLKEKTCYLMNASDQEICDLLTQFGDFSKIRTATKRAKRIGLLFSSFEKSLSLREDEYKIIEDVKHGKYNFTDGCGLMSCEFAQEIRDSHRLDYIPSVVQVRYQGFKGVLVISRQMDPGVKVHFRKSMRKFCIPDEHMRRSCTTFGVVKYSRSYTIGYLNKQVTMLLADSGVEHAYLTRLQTEFQGTLMELCTNRERAESYLCWKGKKKLLDRLHIQGLGNTSVKSELRSLQDKEIKKMMKQDTTEDSGSDTQTRSACKLRVLVPKSRLVFGVCDPFGELEYGQCYFQPTLFDEEQMDAFLDAQVVAVTRNPCYYPGDIRVLKLVKDKPMYGDLIDCIVFPVKGKRPHSDEMSGGDLDGDEFFVSWDCNLIPQYSTSPFDYSPSSPLQVVSGLIEDRWRTFSTSLAQRIADWGHEYLPSFFGTSEEARSKAKDKERKQMREYFTTFNNDLVGRVDAIFMKYAALYGPSCWQCVYLNRFFSDAVDMIAEKEKVIGDIRELERKYHHLALSQPIRQTDVLNGILVAAGWAKPPFKPGDDIWTRMENTTEQFVSEMQRRR